MDYKDLLKDFAKRTKHNLELIERSRTDGNESFEVTQLINSCLGLLVMPQERYMRDIPEIPISDLRLMGWEIPRVVGSTNDVEDLSELIKHLRNAIAHFNIEFVTDGCGRISALKITNKFRGVIQWQAEMGINELRSFLDKFVDLILQDDRYDRD